MTDKLYPAWLDLTGIRVLVVGAGRIGRRRAKTLLDGGAEVTVLALRFLDEFLVWEKEGRVVLLKKEFSQEDLDGFPICFACTNQPEINQDIVDKSRSRGMWVSSATRAMGRNVLPGAVIRRGCLNLSVSTGGKAPILARRLRACLEAFFSEKWGSFSEEISRRRNRETGTGPERDIIERRIRRAFQQAASDYTDSTLEKGD